MDRQELTKHATEWIKEDTTNRSMIFLASDEVDGQIKESVTVGGTIEAMTITLVDVMSHEEQLRAVKRIIQHCDEGTLQRIVIDYAESNSDDYNSHFCEQC